MPDAFDAGVGARQHIGFISRVEMIGVHEIGMKPALTEGNTVEQCMPPREIQQGADVRPRLLVQDAGERRFQAVVRLPERLRDTPISEAAIVGAAVGFDQFQIAAVLTIINTWPRCSASVVGTPSWSSTAIV